jgi:hypothetical protein
MTDILGVKTEIGHNPPVNPVQFWEWLLSMSLLTPKKGSFWCKTAFLTPF